MYTTRCTECGATENTGVKVFKEDTKNRESNPDSTISVDIRTTFYCGPCDRTETINTGVLPEKNAECFESCKETASEDMVVTIDDTPVQYQSVDEQVTENAHYSPEGVRGTSKIHHVHIHARNPPTFSKGKHRVQIGDYVEENMILADICYHNESSRTLKFFKSLEDDIMEPLDKETEIARDAPVGD